MLRNCITCMVPGKALTKRSIYKAITWRLLATLTTFAVALIISGDVTLASLVGGWEAGVKLVLYYLHEVAWNHLGKPIATKVMPAAAASAQPETSAAQRTQYRF